MPIKPAEPLHWLLSRFVYVDLSSLTPGQVLDFLREMALFVRAGGSVKVPTLEGHELDFFTLQHELREGLELLRKEKRWSLTHNIEGSHLHRRSDGSVKRQIVASQMDAFRLRVAEVIDTQGDAIRFCDAPGCLRGFVPTHRHQKFHAVACGQRLRVARARARERKKK